VTVATSARWSRARKGALVGGRRFGSWSAPPFTRRRGKRSWSCDSVRFGRSRSTTERQRRVATATDGRQSQRSSRAADRSSLRRRETAQRITRSGSSPGSRGRHRMHGCSSLTIRVCTCQPDASSELEWTATSIRAGNAVGGVVLLSQGRATKPRARVLATRGGRISASQSRDDPGEFAGKSPTDRGALNRKRFALKPGERWRF
jgi:hypothetical protein